MSRIGKQSITLPEKTEVEVSDGFIRVKGPLGELKKRLHPALKVDVEGGEARVVPIKESPETSAIWGTFASHLRNMTEGVNKPFEKKLSIEGVGYRWEVKGDKLVLNIGFSHSVELAIPAGLKVTAEKSNLSVSGIDKELVGQFAAKVRLQKKAEPYKGKGIKYEGEVVRRKQGKKSA